MSLEINSNPSPPPPPLPTWTRLEDGLFEQAIVLFPEETPDRWQNIAALLPGKTPAEIQQHYEDLVHDVTEIESGRIELPRYTENSYIPSWVSSEFRRGQISFQPNLKKHHNGTEKKKGIPWSEEEHRRFLVGLHKYGKGDWRSISRNAVVTRTPIQVASHAQKYFIRLNSMNKDNKRSSIHDITTVDNDLESVVMAQPSDQNCEGGPAIL